MLENSEKWSEKTFFADKYSKTQYIQLTIKLNGENQRIIKFERHKSANVKWLKQLIDFQNCCLLFSCQSFAVLHSLCNTYVIKLHDSGKKTHGICFTWKHTSHVKTKHACIMLNVQKKNNKKKNDVRSCELITYMKCCFHMRQTTCAYITHIWIHAMWYYM